MKKLLTVLSLLFVFTFAYSQDNIPVLIYQCTEESIQVSDGEWESATVSYFIRVDANKSIIEIDNVIKSKFYIRSAESIVTKPDEDGDTYTTRTFLAYDEEGLDCGISITTYELFNTTFFLAVYNDILMAWSTSLMH